MRNIICCLALIFYWNSLLAQTYQELVKVRDSLYAAGNYKDAYPYFEESMRSELLEFGDTSELYIKSLISLGACNSELNNNEKQKELFEKIEFLLKKSRRESSRESMTYFSLRGGDFLSKNNLDSAEYWYAKGLNLAKNLYKEEYASTIKFQINLALISMYRGSFFSAEKSYIEIKNFIEKNALYPSRDYGTILNNLGYIYATIGKIESAEECFNKYRENSIKMHDIYGELTSLGNLSLLYGYYYNREAERISIIESILSKYKEITGVYSEEYAGMLFQKGQFVLQNINAKEAIPIFNMSADIFEKINLTHSTDYMNVLSALGSACISVNDSINAYKYYNNAMHIMQEMPGIPSEYFAAYEYFMGRYYFTFGDKELAKKHLKSAINGYQEIDLTDALNYKSAISFLMEIYLSQDSLNNVKSIIDSLDSTSILNKKAAVYSNLIKLKFIYLSKSGDFFQANETLQEEGNLLNQINKKELFIKSEKFKNKNTIALSEFSNRQLSFYYNNKSLIDPVGLYNQALFRKNILFCTSLEIKQYIHASGDSSLLNLYERWKSAKENLAYWETLPKSTQDVSEINYSALKYEADSLEQNFSIKSALFKNLNELPAKTWTDLRATLRPEEAVIDIVRFNYQHVEEKKMKQIMYAVFLIRSNSPEPQLLFLENGNDLNSYFIEQYQNDLRAGHAPSREVYAGFWGKIDPYLKGVKTIYFVPDGIYHKINLSNLRRADGKYLSEIYDIRILQSAGELLQPDLTPYGPSANTAVLVGNPRFDLSDMTNTDMTSGGINWRSFLADSTFTLAPLPASAKEITDLSRILDENGFETHTMTDTAATEVRLKATGKPRVLHMATHGHFLQSPKREHMLFDEEETADNPMLRSMLFFAGATNTLREQPLPPGIGDGVFTAYEAANLDLNGTELVVLSACNTGLGKIENGEGVFGMQRAFRYAGAHYIVMSLWEVEDQATREFMTTFYRHWLEDKKAIPEAFRQTQLDLMRTQTPFQWGAFVLMGN